jgi:hypothetical protein
VRGLHTENLITNVGTASRPCEILSWRGSGPPIPLYDGKLRATLEMSNPVVDGDDLLMQHGR